MTIRPATIDDIVHRLTGTPYTSTAETALADGMGDVLNITVALNAAIEDGYVTVVDTRDTSYGGNIRFVALVDGIHYCRTCLDGCQCETGSGTSCDHDGCWGPDATNKCQGVAYSRASQHPSLFTVADAVAGMTFGEAMAGAR